MHQANYKEFNFNLKQDKNVIEAFSDTALLSYLIYVDGQIVIDEITPKIDLVKYLKTILCMFQTLWVNQLCHMFMAMLYVEGMLMVYTKLWIGMY